MTGVPQTSYGTPIVLMNMFRGNVQPAFPGCADDVANGIRWGGSRFELTWTQGESIPKVLEWQFMEWIYLAGGWTHPIDGQFGDYIDYEILAPASPASSVPGAGAYAKQEILPGSGINRFVPQAGGGWNLDLAATLNTHVGFTAVVPVPNTAGQGFFDWSSDTEEITLASGGNGTFDLLDKQVTLANYTPKARASGSQWRSFLIPGLKPRRVLAHWKHRLKWTVTGGSVSRNLEWDLFMAREKTA